MKEEMVRFQNVTLTSGGEKYLDNMNFYMLKGEIMGFVASRGKGRGEFIDLIQKNSPIGQGRIFFDGKQVNSYLHSPGDRNRVYAIRKKSSLIEGLSVTDNIFVIRKGFKKFVIKDQVLKEQSLRLAEELGFSVNLDKSVNQFTVLERCEVELLKAYMMGCELIMVLDPGDFLVQREMERFHELIRGLKSCGMSFLYVCNHHEEAFKIADRVSLYSNGRIKKVFEKPEMTDEAIAPYILSFDVFQQKKLQNDAVKKLEFINVYSHNVDGLSFSVKERECVTVLDTDNAYADEVVKILTGEEPVLAGRITYNGKPYNPQKERDFLKNGIAVIPENPTKTFLFSEQSYMENLTFLLDKKLGKSVIRNTYLKSIRREYQELSQGGIDESDIRKLDIHQLYGLVYFRVLLYHPQLAVLVQPLAYGDMICRRYILELVQMLKDAGITVLILAGSISDNLHVSDRLAVLKNGKAMLEFKPEEFYLISR